MVLLARRWHLAQLSADLAVTLALVLFHSVVLICQFMTFSVAMNSKRSNALIALLIASNFVEIKGEASISFLHTVSGYLLQNVQVVARSRVCAGRPLVQPPSDTFIQSLTLQSILRVKEQELSAVVLIMPLAFTRSSVSVHRSLAAISCPWGVQAE